MIDSNGLLSIHCLLTIASIVLLILDYKWGMGGVWLSGISYLAYTHLYKNIPYILLLTLFAGISLLIDRMYPTFRRWYFWTTSDGMWGAVIGSLVGLFILGWLTFIPGLIVGSLLGELFSKNQEVFKATIGGVVGFLGPSGIRLLIALEMAGLFLHTV